SYIILPAFNLALFKLGLLIRLTRAGTAEVMSSDYVRFARAQGLSESKVVGLHVLKNISIPIVTVFGLELGSTLAFAVVTETVFNWPGMGTLAFDAISNRDYPVLQGTITVLALFIVLINLLVDIAYGLIDPRIRTE
ncbi:ABC transporter permease, partial [Vibrio parahaemolyticus]|nr:ABC transporter permease [Vibrio parahaemolyticus]